MLLAFMCSSFVPTRSSIAFSLSVHPSIHACSNLVFYQPISYKFQIWITSIKLPSKFKYGFLLMSDNQNGPHLSVFTCGHSILVIYYQITSKFLIWITFIKLSPKFKYWYCLMNDNQDGRQNGCHLSVCFCPHSNLVIYYLISSKFHDTWITFIKLSPKFEYAGLHNYGGPGSLSHDFKIWPITFQGSGPILFSCEKTHFDKKIHLTASLQTPQNRKYM